MDPITIAEHEFCGTAYQTCCRLVTLAMQESQTNRNFSEETEDLICILFGDDFMMINNAERFFKQLYGVLQLQFSTNYLDNSPDIVENLTMEFYKLLKYTDLALHRLDDERKESILRYLGDNYCTQKLFSLSQCFPELIQDV